MERGPVEVGAPETSRFELVEELDLLEKRNLRRWPVSVALGAFLFCLISAVADASLIWGAGAAVSFAAFLALMVPPIRRFRRIAEIRDELAARDGPDKVGPPEEQDALPGGVEPPTSG